MFGAARAASTGWLLECVWYFCLALYGPGSLSLCFALSLLLAKVFGDGVLIV